jgi:hypothetical protein
MQGVRAFRQQEGRHSEQNQLWFQDETPFATTMTIQPGAPSRMHYNVAGLRSEEENMARLRGRSDRGGSGADLSEEQSLPPLVQHISSAVLPVEIGVGSCALPLNEPVS